MTKIPVDSLIAIFRQMYDEHWKYTWGHAAKGDVDCSGAFVYAYRQFGQSIYHGSNAIARRYVIELRPVSEAKPGMAAFKFKKPGANGYALPAAYQKGGSSYNGDLNDYFHIGLVDETGKAVYNAQNPDAGFGKSSVTKWGAVAYLKAVEYPHQVDPTPTPDPDGKQTMTIMYVTAKSGSTVRVREKPDKTAKVLAELKLGTEVKAGPEISGWREIIWSDSGGYMMAEFLTEQPNVTYTVKCYGMSWAQVMKLRETCPTAEVIKE